MFKKIILSFGFLIAFIGLSSFQIVLAEDHKNEEITPMPGMDVLVEDYNEEITPMLGMDVLVEEDINTSKKQKEEMIQSGKEHPELALIATPVTTNETLVTTNATAAAFPYSFSYDFKWNVWTESFSNLKYPNIKLSMDVKASSAQYVYASLYDGSGKNRGTRMFRTGMKSTASWLNVGMGNYKFYLYNSDGGVRTYGTGYASGY